MKSSQNIILIAFCVLIFSILQLSAQKRIIPRDSLILSLGKAKTDSAKLYYLNYLAYFERIGEQREPKYLKQGLDFAHDIESHKYICNFLIKYGGYYINLNNYSEALNYFQEAIKVSEEHQLFDVQIRANYNIGVLYYQWKNYLKAEEYVLRAIDISDQHQDSSIILGLYNGIGSINDALKRHDRAKQYMLKYLDLCLERGKSNETILAYYNLGVIYKKLNLPDSSLYYLHQGLKIAITKKDTLNLFNIFSSLVDYYLIYENLDSSAYYVDASLAMLKKSHPIRKKIDVYNNAFNYFKKLGNSDSALYYIQEYHLLKDSLFNKEQLNRITQLETEYETEKYQVEIKNLEQKNKIKSLQLYGSIIGSISLIIILILSYRSYKLRSNLLAQNQILSEEKSNALNVRVEFQRKEMANNALYIVNQNKLFDGLLKDLKKIKKLSEEEQRSAYQSLILQLQKSKKTFEQKAFEIKLKETHRQFYSMLKEKYPDLTTRDMDLCAYLKLNMSSKEIAYITNQSIRSIEMARSRLRKKLGVDSGANLVEYIQSL